MINQGNNVPNNTIAIFPYSGDQKPLSKNKINTIVKREGKKRDWFPPDAYRCLPITIGNQYGFTVALNYDIAVEWNGGNAPKDVIIYYAETKENIKNKVTTISSDIGAGILTITTPFMLRTPPNVNIMTINPPNYVLPNMTVLTGVIEADNLRIGFPFNIKLQMPNIKIVIPAGSPLAAFIPIPRYYADNFELKYADELFDKSVIEEENQAYSDWINYNKKTNAQSGVVKEKQYLRGVDIYGNPFLDHQKV
jgi:hypothetical protein